MTTQYSILFKQEQAHDDAIWSVAWGRNRNDGTETVISGSLDDLVKVWKCLISGHAMPIRSLTFSPDSQLLVTASDDGYIKIYDVQHANLAGTLSGHASWVLNVAFCPDNSHFVSSSSDKTVKVWDVPSRTCVHTFFDHQDQVWGVQYNGNGSKIVSVGDDQEIHIYDCPV
nr:superkiller complex protein 8 [Anolis sagrei ordinatus]